MENDERFGGKDWIRLIAGVAWLIALAAWPRVTGGVSLMIAGGAMMAFNAMIFWASVVQKGHAPAVAPIFGGILAAAGIALLPVEGIWKWAWLPLLLDWGGVPMFVYGLLVYLGRRGSRSG